MEGRNPGYREAEALVREVERLFDPALGISINPLIVGIMLSWQAAAAKLIHAPGGQRIDVYNPFTDEAILVRLVGEKGKLQSSSIMVKFPGGSARVDLRDNRRYIKGPKPALIKREAEKCLSTGRMRLLSLLGFESWRSSPCRCLALDTGSRNPYRVRLAIYTRLAIAVAVHNAILLGRLSDDVESPLSIFYEARWGPRLPPPGPYLAVNWKACSSNRRVRQSKYCKGAIIPSFLRIYQSTREFAERCIAGPLIAVQVGIPP